MRRCHPRGGAALHRFCALLSVALLATGCAQLPATDAGGDAMAFHDATGAPAPSVTAPEAVPTPPAPVAESAPPAAAPPEPPPNDLWPRIRKGFAMRDLDNALVREWEQWYSSRPDYVGRMVERSRRVLFHVVEEVERRRMPLEVALLPMIESAYNPEAYSRAHASGMWQFIPSTGRLYGLRQDFWYDGRRDIVAATTAALDYLEKLHGMFGDWELALASYNWGEGAVGRAVARNQAKGLPADYENLAMPSETRNYLPKLQAVKNIVANPARFGLQLAEIPNEPYFATVTTRRHIDVKVAAALAEISIEEFRFLNPAHNKPVINANAAETIVLPRHKVATFRANLESHDKPLVSWQAYTVRAGEKTESVAAKHGISVAELKQVNGMPANARIKTGQALLVPVKAGAEPHLPDLPAPALASARTTKTRYVPASRKGPTTVKTSQRKPVAAKTAKSTRKAAAPRPVKKQPPALAKSATPKKTTVASVQAGQNAP
jgi:membrane-bound lytic murein transglycosylase D